MTNARQQILDMASSRGVIRPRDLTAQGLPRVTLTRLVREGLLVRIDRGLYTLPDRQISEYTTLTEVASKYPEGIICLLSALRLHNLTTQAPFEVWLAIAHKSRAPKMSHPPLRIVRFSGKALTAGVVEQEIDGVPVKITSVARTVVDCFRFRNKIGLDVALQALGRQGKRLTSAWMTSGAMPPNSGSPPSCARVLNHARETSQDFNLVLTRFCL